LEKCKGYRRRRRLHRTTGPSGEAEKKNKLIIKEKNDGSPLLSFQRGRDEDWCDLLEGAKRNR